MKKKLYLLFAISTILTCYLSAQTTVRNDTIDDTSIVTPESMNENLSKLLYDWQLDFTKSNSKCVEGNNVVYHDTVYANRLHALPTVMELSYNKVVQKYIDLYANRRRHMVSYMLAIGQYYFPMFEEMLYKHGLPLELKYLPVIESALNPVAVSRAGATGLWQFMLKTGRQYGMEINSLVDERRDPYKSTEAAVLYLKDLYAIYQDWNLAIAAYNCGPGNVNKAIARSGGHRDYWQIYFRLPRETRGYVPAFIAANYIMNYYDSHNICPVESYNDMSAVDTIHVNNYIHMSQISDVLNIPLQDLRRLNPQYKKDIIPGNYRGGCSVVLPTNKIAHFIEKKKEISEYKKNRYNTHRLNTDQYVGNSPSSNSKSYDVKNTYYVVKRGDNLSAIARRHGTSVDRIKSWNNLNSNRIHVGKRLIVKQTRTPRYVYTTATNESQRNNQTRRDTRSSTQGEGSDIISNYLKRQSKKVESQDEKINNGDTQSHETH